MESHMDDNCQGVEIEFTALDERVKTQCETIGEIKDEILEIRKTYKKVTIEIILGIMLMVVALFIHI